MCIETTRLIQRPCKLEIVTDDTGTSSLRRNDSCYQDQLSTMLAQESLDAYACIDYLGVGCDTTKSNTPLLNQEEEEEEETCFPIDVTCRVKMSQWAYQLIDYSRFKRSTVAMAMNLLDRFLSASSACPCARQGIRCRTTYQLLCMTTLFMAMKMNENSDIDSRVLSSLSRDAYSARDLLDMERQILHTLKWRLNTPMAVDVLKYLFVVLPSIHDDRLGLSEDTLSNIFYLCSFQIEVAVGDYYFVTQKQSTIAIASFLNVLEANANLFCIDINEKHYSMKTIDVMDGMVETIDTMDTVTPCHDHHFILNSLLEDITFCTSIDIYSNTMENARKRLKHLLYLNDVMCLSMEEEEKSPCHSPTHHQDTSADVDHHNVVSNQPSREEDILSSSSSSSQTPSPNCVSKLNKRQTECDTHVKKPGNFRKSSSFHAIFRGFCRS